MARLPRYYINNQPQHILLQSVGNAEVFHHEDDYEYYRDCLAYAADTNNLKIHAFAIMPDHVSILASPWQRYQHISDPTISWPKLCTVLQLLLRPHRNALGGSISRYCR